MKPMTVPISVKVKKRWHARCGITVFTQPKGTELILTQWDPDTKQYLVDFGGDLMDWFHYSVIEQHCEHPYDDA